MTLSGTQSFSSIDGSSSDHDGAANGVFTVNDGNLVVNGAVNCNDDTTESACAMAFAVSGNLVVNSGGALYAENRSGGGTGGAITLTVGGNLALNGTAIVSSASRSSSGSAGGAITANVSGTVALASGTTIDSGSSNSGAGAITIAAGSTILVDGNVLSGPSRTILATKLTGLALDGGTANQVGGAITIGSTTFAEPALVVGTNANIISQGDNNGAGPVTLDACGIQVRGLVAALSRKDSAAKVVIRSGKDVLVDGRDLGATGLRMGRVRADAPSGTALNKGVDIFAKETIDLYGPGGSLYLITSLPGLHDSKSYGGLIRITSLEDAVNGSGNLIDDGHTASGDTGGTVQISAKGNVNLNTAVIRALGDFSTNNPNRGGGTINVRSYSGDVIWTNGTGDVRPVGSSSGLPLADQGKIVVTACGTVTTAGSTFPVNGTATSMHPETHTGVCSPAAPSLPTGVPPLVTCNTPPVANDTAASTNEDTTVTVFLSGTDADGDSLTFTIVSGPANGALGPVVSTGPTTATVDYTPGLNYNGGDSFVFQANDGNGGTDQATAAITIAPVNDPPSFLIGPDVTRLEDSGAHTVANWVTAISPGPADESGQTVTFTTTNSNPSLFSVQPFVASNGTLTFTPAAHAYGSATITVFAQDNGGTLNGGDDTSNSQTATITIAPVNDEPSFVKGPDQTVNEDAGAQNVSNWATGISAGPNESGQTFTFVTSDNNNALFSAQPAVASDGTLTYTPAANANGSATVTVYLTDDGGTDDGGDDTSPSQTFTITVNAVNDAPSFTSGGDVTVLEDSGAYSASWAGDISAGPSDENGQTFTFNTSNDNNALFASQPSISSTGALTFTPATNAYGSATVTVTLSDNGGTLNGGSDTSAAQTFVINITPVNDEPSFTGGGNVTVNEDSGAYSAAWATAISAGPNESSQTVTFVASNDNTALFSVQPSVSSSGVLSFTPAANAFGSATVTVHLTDDGGTDNGGDNTSPSQTFTITVNSVNDAPSFTSGGNVSVAEDSGAYSAAWATGISAGPANESGQSVTFVTANNNNALFTVQPSVSSSGVLSFTVAANVTGSATVTIYAQDNGGTANGGVDTSASQTFSITVNNVNDEPTFTPGGDQTSNEDAGPQSVVWATNISAGPANESGQTVTFFVSNDNNALFSAQPAINSSGTLTYTAAPNANGTATVTVFAQDNGGTANGGDDTSATYTFTITIVAVNDEPSFTGGGDVTVNEDSGAYSAAWATGISAGPADEAGQSLTFNVVSNSNPGLFASGPSVSSTGVLSFTPAANAFGSATITVNLQDNGGTANGGDNTSANYTFTISVSAVNDAPSFTSGGDVTVNEDSGLYSQTWATSISAGPNESGQTVTFNVTNDNNALFLVQPSISSGGVLTFTTNLNAHGSASVTVFAQDNGGTANGGLDTSASVQFTISVTPVNDAPTAGADAWDTLGNTELRVDLAGGLTPKVVDTTPSGNGVRDNDSDPEGDPFVVTGIVGCSDVSTPYDCTLGDGSKVSMLANGSFSYTPGPGNTSGSFQYTITDTPSFGSPASATGTVTITIYDRIWYVKGSAAAGGNGTSIAPFNNFASLNGAGDVDSAGDTIFVHNSAVTGSIAMEASQKLHGEGVGLKTNQNLNGNGSPQVLVAPGVKPTVVSGGDTVTVDGVAGVDIAGLSLSSTAGNAIDVNSNGASPATSVTIHDNTITSAAQEGIDVNATATAGTTVLVNNTSIASSGHGFDVTSNGPAVIAYTNGTIASAGGSGIRMDGSMSGNLTVAGLANVTIDGTTPADGISITAAKFDAAPGGSFDVVNTGTISVGSSVNPVGAAAVVLTSVSGDLGFGTLNAYGASGVAISGTALYTGAAGMRVTSAGGAISASAGTGLRVTSATIGSSNLNFTNISATGGANGILLDTTDTVGGLVVNGDGTNTGLGGNGSGGTISATVGADGASAGNGVYLNNAHNVTLRRMQISNHPNHGVRGVGSSNFTLEYSTVSTAGTTGAGGIEEGTVSFNNWSGTGAITGSSISGGRANNLRVVNTTGTLNRLVVTGSNFGLNGTAADSNNNILLESRNAGTVLNFTLQSSTVRGSRADWLNASAAAGGTMDAVIGGNTAALGNSFTNLAPDNHPAAIANGNRVLLQANGTLTYNVSNNTLKGSLGTAIAANSLSAIAVMNGTIIGNAIGVAGTANSGSTSSSGIAVFSNAGGDHTALIDGNTVRQYNSHGILLQFGDQQGNVANIAMTVKNNSVNTPGTLLSNFNGLHLNHGVVSTDTLTSCIQIENNNLAGSGSPTGTAPNNNDIRLRQRVGTTVQLPGYVGPARDNTDNVVGEVMTFLSGTRGNTFTTGTANSVSTGGGYIGGSCSFP